MIIVLIIQYLLGMYVNMFAAAPEDPAFKTEGVFPKIVFGLHAFVGLGLLTGSIATLVLGLKSEKAAVKKTSFFAFGAIVLSFLAGVSTVALKNTPSQIASYVMSIGFLASLIAYGKLFFLLKR